jgi:ABC-type bacteriocin/lantibiotic exporter with double-glycine peptidase domain
MLTDASPPTLSDAIDELSSFVVGGGLLLMVLCPFAIPLVALVAVLAIGFALIVLVCAPLVAILTFPMLLMRRRVRRRRPDATATASATETMAAAPPRTAVAPRTAVRVDT